MFKSLRVKNFRAITDLQVEELGRVNLFVGHNACGKTTLLESIFFLVGGANPQLLLNVNAFRGMAYTSKALLATYFRNMDTDTPIEILGSQAEHGGWQQLMIRPRYEPIGFDMDASVSLHSEVSMVANSDTVQAMEGLRLEFRSPTSDESGMVSEVFFKGGELVVEIGENRKARSARGTFVMALPTDLRDRFSEVQRKKRVHEVVALLKEIEPTLEDLRLLDPAGSLYADTGAPELIPVNLMGGGIVRFLSVALAMLNFQDGYVLIDEIENGLDRSSQRKLWNAIFSWAQKLNVQVFASTHSRECIKAFSDCAEETLFASDAKLFRIERKGDKSRAVEYTPDLITESLESDWEIR